MAGRPAAPCRTGHGTPRAAARASTDFQRVRHAGLVGIAQELVAHVERRLERGDTIEVAKRPASLQFGGDAAQRLQPAQPFFEQRGPFAIVLARFVPIVRTLAPITAGAARMGYGVFTLFNVIGAVVWAVGLVLLGSAHSALQVAVALAFTGIGSGTLFSE